MKFTWRRAHSWILLVGALIGLLASFTLTYDTMRVASDAGYLPACSLNPVLSCVSVMESEPGSVIGSIPNSMFGIVAFSLLVTFASLLLLGSSFSKRVWQLAVIAAGIGFVFVHYLIYESLFRIQSLCPWCMATWTVVTPIFVLIFANYLGMSDQLPQGLRKFVTANYLNIIVLWFLAVAALILVNFWSYWQTLLP